MSCDVDGYDGAMAMCTTILLSRQVATAKTVCLSLVQSLVPHWLRVLTTKMGLECRIKLCSVLNIPIHMQQVFSFIT